MGVAEIGEPLAVFSRHGQYRLPVSSQIDDFVADKAGAAEMFDQPFPERMQVRRLQGTPASAVRPQVAMKARR